MKTIRIHQKLLAVCLTTATLALSSNTLKATVTLNGADSFVTSTPQNGNFVVSGDLSVVNGLDLGTSAGDAALSALQIDFYNTGSILKTVSFDLTDSTATFLWRDSMSTTGKTKMKLEGPTNFRSTSRMEP